MAAPFRPVWTEGMLLSPQHLQALDRHGDALVEARVAAIAPLSWGLLDLEVDAAALAAGQLRLLRLEAIMPGGLPVAGGDDVPPPRSLADRFPASARSLGVYLAVAREREGVAAFGPAGAAVPPRFLVSGRTVQDATSPDASVSVQLARANPVLLLGDEPTEDYDAIKIAEVQRAGSGQLVTDPTFVPPCLRVSASPRLLAGARDVLARAIAKERELAQARQGRNAAELAPTDLIRLMQLLALDQHIPWLAHVSEDGAASTRELFLGLAQLAGQLCAFSGDDVSTLPRFNYADLRSTFEPLFARLAEALGGMAQREYTVVPLEKRAGGLFLARFGDERLLRNQLVLCVQSDLGEVAVADQFPRLCKIAAAADIQALVHAATPGLPIRPMLRPPQQVPVQPGAVYFELVPGDRYWQNIVAGRNAALYLPPPFDPARTRLELLAVQDGGAAPGRPPR